MKAKRALRKNTHGVDSWRLTEWVTRTLRRWEASGQSASLYLHPCGDLMLYPEGVESPLSDSLLVGVYAGTDADIRGDIEVALVDLEEWGVAA